MYAVLTKVLTSLLLGYLENTYMVLTSVLTGSLVVNFKVLTGYKIQNLFLFWAFV